MVDEGVVVVSERAAPAGRHERRSRRRHQDRPGIVEEPVYSGFQSKFYVKLDAVSETLVKVYKQHTVFLDDGPDIEWLDEVYVSWHADDGYLVKDSSQ